MRSLNRSWAWTLKGRLRSCAKAEFMLRDLSVRVELVPFRIVLDLGFHRVSAAARLASLGRGAGGCVRPLDLKELRLGVSGFVPEDNYLGHLG